MMKDKPGSPLERVFRSMERQACEVRLRPKGGGELHALLESIFVQHVHGQVSCRTSVIDITERKRAEEQLRQASQYSRSLIEASLDPLVTISPEGKITDINEATIRVTGVARKALIDTDFSDYFTEPERAREV